MPRFRRIFAVVAMAILLPTVLLVRRALESVEIERRARHATVAERMFDEMERALSGFLATEEDRPFGQYALELAAPPALPFVLGYFQIDPDGSPRYPDHASAKMKEVESSVDAFWRSGAAGDERQAALNTQAPGSTLELAEADGAKPVQQLEQTKNQVSAYDALRSLNKGIEQRADRKAKISREYASEPKEAAQSLDADVSSGRRPRRSNEADRFELSPMVGRLVSERRLMLYRTVVHERQGYRQGFLLDVAALGDWLRARALGGGELAPYVTVTFSPAARSADDERAYRHRFAEPFEGISAELVLAPLPGIGGAGAVYALGTLSLVIVALGLAALYRMVSVVVRYAEQRQNFVAAVTHELKTPLTAIRMYGEMLRDGIVPSETKRDEYHRYITAESERLTRLVNNVLEFSRLEKRAPSTRLETGDLGAVVREAATLLGPHVEGAGFTIRLDVEESLPAVRFERDAVLQTLFNLVDNAVKYAANGAGSKEILLGCRRSGGGISLRVRDHGPGVAPRHLRKIFEPFYRGETELTRRTKGTGLGLALVRGLADEMHASVAGRNCDDGGFEVEIVVPTVS